MQALGSIAENVLHLGLLGEGVGGIMFTYGPSTIIACLAGATIMLRTTEYRRV